MKFHWISDALKISSLLLVSVLLIGHGTPLKTHKRATAWHETSVARIEFDLSSQIPVRRFLVEVSTENYLPRHTNVPLWSEKFLVQGTQGTVDPSLTFQLTDTAGNERFRMRSHYINHISRGALVFVNTHEPYPAKKNQQPPIIVAKCNRQQKTCMASSVLVISRGPGATANQKISLEYVSKLLGPSYCTDCAWEMRPRKPDGAKINLRLTELK